MGYYTRYELSVVPESDKDKVFADIDSDIREYLLSGESLKWYEHEHDLKEVSLKHPTTLLILDGEGEQSRDIWRTFFMNGQVENHKMQWTPPAGPKEGFGK